MPEDYDDYEDNGEDEYDDDCDSDDCDDEDRFNQSDPGSEDYLIDGVGFANPGGNSALRAATKTNPRNLPCPTCKQPNRLTPADVRKHYQCDSCADRAEGGFGSYGEY